MGAIFIFIRESEFGSSSSHILSSEPRATKARETSTGFFFGSTSAAVGRGKEGKEERGERKKPFSSTFRAISRFERGSWEFAKHF